MRDGSKPEEARAPQSPIEPRNPLSFWEDKDVLAGYWDVRDQPDGPKAAIEEPIVLEFAEEFAGRRVLDLGCGDGRLGRRILEQGAVAYLGLEGSREMVRAATTTLAGTKGEVRLQDLESWRGEDGQRFDMVISQLALQYVRNVGRVFEKALGCIDPKGVFIFSIEHPVMTCSSDGEIAMGIAKSWRVHAYFHEGDRVSQWLNAEVVKQHRTLETYMNELRRCGFLLDRFSEGRPDIRRFQHRDIYNRRLEVPICATFRCIPEPGSD